MPEESAQVRGGRNATVQSAPGDLDGDLIGDNTRMKEILGVTPATSLLNGLRSMT